MPYAGGAKEALPRASLDSPRPEEVSSGLLAFGGLGLEASDRQRYSRSRPFGRDKVYPKRIKSYILSSLT